MSSPIRTRDLEAVIDAVVESYDGPEEINNLESAALPNKRAVVQAYNHLKPVIYMGFYSQRSLTRSNLRYAVSEHLYPACEILVDQIGRALSYEERAGQVKTPWPTGWSEEVVLRLLRCLPELRRRRALLPLYAPSLEVQGVQAAVLGQGRDDLRGLRAWTRQVASRHMADRQQ